MDWSIPAGIAFYGGGAALIVWWISAVVRGDDGAARTAATAQLADSIRAEHQARLAEQARQAQAAQELMATASAATAMAQTAGDGPVQQWPTETPAYAESAPGEGHMRYAAPTTPPPSSRPEPVRDYPETEPIQPTQPAPPTSPPSPPAADTWATGTPTASMGPDGWGAAPSDPFGDVGIRE